MLSSNSSTSIAFLCHPYHRGGVTRWMVDMAAEYARRKMDVYFVTVTPKTPFFSAGGRETMASLVEEQQGIKLVSRKVGWDFELGTEDYRANVYAGLLYEWVPASSVVILSDDFSVWKTSLIDAGKFNFVGVLHADEDHYYDLANKYKKRIGIFTSVSERITRQLLLKERDIVSSKVFTIPCGIPLPAISTHARNEQLLKIVFVGRITQYQKRVFDIPSICKLLVSRGVNFEMEIIGSGSDEEALKEQVKVFGLDKNISFLGWRSKDEIFEHLEVADVLLLTSDFEGMPIAVMEALSMGCGVVSTRVSGVEDYEKLPLAKNCLWLFNVGDVNAAVDNIVYAGKVQVSIRSQAARQLAGQEFSIQQCFERYEAAIASTPSTPNASSGLQVSYIERIKSYALSFMRFLRVRYFLPVK